MAWAQEFKVILDNSKTSLKVPHTWAGLYCLLTVDVWIKRGGGMREVTVMWFVYLRDHWCEDPLWTWRSCAWMPSLSVEEVCWFPPSLPHMLLPMGRWVVCLWDSYLSVPCCAWTLCLPNSFSSTSDTQKLWVIFQRHISWYKTVPLKWVIP